MIDYNKLKIAHEMAHTSDSYYFQVSLGMDDGCICLYDANKSDGQLIYDTESIDDLISKLTELTKPQSKYEVGNEIGG